jgi:cell division protein FtsL
MMVSSPLQRQNVAPNLRKVNTHDSTTSSSPKTSKNKPYSSLFKLSALKPTKVMAFTLMVAVMGFFYLTHVFSTQELLTEVQKLEMEYKDAQLIHDELQLRYDRMTGPANIYRKARELGFINAGPADYVLEVP